MWKAKERSLRRLSSRRNSRKRKTPSVLRLAKKEEKDYYYALRQPTPFLSEIKRKQRKKKETRARRSQKGRGGKKLRALRRKTGGQGLNRKKKVTTLKGGRTLRYENPSQQRKRKLRGKEKREIRTRKGDSLVVVRENGEGGPKGRSCSPYQTA